MKNKNSLFWEEITSKIIESISNIKTTDNNEALIKLNIMIYIYKSLESEEIFNENCKILNKEYKKLKGDSNE